ncbi:helix-turn-helix transcriptional regulator [Ectopseudomonas mendocina]|uniref:helix-turn-helix transcriptional regulator n=1 Tax=Ectopseudomonas mendocina TaxID=300 RepID=UPI003F014DF4
MTQRKPRATKPSPALSAASNVHHLLRDASTLPVFDPAATLIRINEVVSIVGLARPTIYKLLRQPESGFPQPVRLTESTARGAPVAWVLAEVQAWVLARIAARGRDAA